jgi:hypothetical protein
MPAPDRSSLRNAILSRLTRRSLLRTSGTGVASAVIVGLGGQASSAAAAPSADVVSARAAASPAALAVDARKSMTA